MLYENIKALSKENRIPIYKLEEELQIAQGSICKWNDIKPSYDKVLAVAKIFNVTVEQLVGNKAG